MTRFYDGNHIAEISMTTGDSPDFEQDFFEIGRLKFDEEHNAYMVEDVDYLIDYANDYENCTGDFAFLECGTCIVCYNKYKA